MKILCLGHNGSDTNDRTESLAIECESVNHGLINSPDYIPAEFGYYHTTITDLNYGGIINIAQYFDSIIMFDQPAYEWNHSKPLLSTYKLCKELDESGYDVDYKENLNVQNFIKFDELLKSNKSFCIYPWINLIEEEGHLKTCARGSDNIVKFKNLGNWKENPEFNAIREKMLKGERLYSNCETCYFYEDNGIESYRQHETKDWIAQLGINSLDDLNAIDKPYYYEVRLNNKCNLMCRSCKPEHSNKIDNEHKKYNIEYKYPQSWQYSDINRINIDQLDSKTRVYLTGGEPTVMIEVIEFMEECIRRNKTDFDFTIGTNAAKLHHKFIELASYFPNMNFSVSLDGYGKVNDYWRWGSDFDTVIKNSNILKGYGHNISINCVPSIHNVTNLHLLFEFLDKEFPETAIYLQLNRQDSQSAFNHPNAELAVESLAKCMQTNVYRADGKSTKTGIDTLFKHYSNNPKCNLLNLKEFFDYNDKLDAARGSKLADYIPELDDCRKLIQ